MIIRFLLWVPIDYFCRMNNIFKGESMLGTMWSLDKCTRTCSWSLDVEVCCIGLLKTRTGMAGSCLGIDIDVRRRSLGTCLAFMLDRLVYISFDQCSQFSHLVNLSTNFISIYVILTLIFSLSWFDACTTSWKLVNWVWISSIFVRVDECFCKWIFAMDSIVRSYMEAALLLPLPVLGSWIWSE